MKYYTQFVNRRPVRKEPGGGKRNVSLIGYVPIQKRIESMIDAGKKLMLARAGSYDSDIEGNDLEGDEDAPIRRPGYDKVEVMEHIKKLREKTSLNKIAKKKKNSGEGVEKSTKTVEKTEQPIPEQKVSEQVAVK